MYPDLPETLALLANTKVTQPQPGRKPARVHRRPAWAHSDLALARHMLKLPFMRPFVIAFLYWRSNLSAADIANKLGLNREAVKSIIRRLRVAGEPNFSIHERQIFLPDVSESLRLSE